jgi:hypothetical protein
MKRFLPHKGPISALPPPSPANTNGAQARGCGNSGGFEGSSNSIIARLSASARPIVGSFANSANVPVVSVTAALDNTGQCEINSDRAPAWKNAFASPESPPASGVPSPNAVLHAESTTQSASSFNVEIFEAVNRPSFSGVAFAALGRAPAHPGL